MISATYSSTPDQLEAFCEGIRELIRRHPFTRKDYFHVYVNQFAASSIDILLYCFLRVPDWATELRERQRLFLDIMRLAKKLGIDFAFPTETVHLINSEGGAATPPRPELAGSEQAHALGRREAEEIVKASLGENGDKPPPVVN
jgi:MscS family membrane protein